MSTSAATRPTIESLKALIVEKAGDCYLEHYFSKGFAELTGRPETEVSANVRALSADRLTREKGKGKYERSVTSACESMLYWLEHAADYPVKDLIGFVGSHNQQCVYTVLLGKYPLGASLREVQNGSN
jgi:hypothetical protein